MLLDKTEIKFANQAIYKGDAKWGESNNWYWQGIRCNWRLLGKQNKRPILLLHGFGASSDHWRHNAQPLASAGYRVYGLDLIGFGDSEQPTKKKIPKLDNEIWSKQVADFLEAVVQTKSFGKAILIGNSLGGLTALTTVCFHPELVSAVIAAPLPDPALMQPSKLSKPFWWTKLRDQLATVFFQLLPLEILIPLISRTGLIKIALQAAYHHSIKLDRTLLKLVAKPAQKPTAARALRAMCIGMSTRRKEITAPELLNELQKRVNRTPFLMIWGKQDKLVPLQISKKLLIQYPWLNLVVFDKTGHCPHDESPKQFNEKVLKWLNTNLGEN